MILCGTKTQSCGDTRSKLQNTPENESTLVVLDLVLPCPTIKSLKGLKSFKIEKGNYISH